MDPLSISASVASLSGACAITAKKLFDIVGKFKDAPKTVHDIFSEAKVISLSLSQLHGLFVSDEHTILSQALLTPDIRAALDIALTGCTVTLSCIENETHSLTTKLDRDRKLNFADRSKVVWKDDKFKELLQQLHRQHNVIAILQQGLQMKAIAEIVPLFKTNRATRCIKSAADGTESLRGLYPQVHAAKSFLESFESANGIARTFSVISERQFEFDDVITSSQAYRRVLVAATHTLRQNNPGGQSANQARKISAIGTSRLEVPSGSATREPMLAGDPNNVVQQFRGYLDHVEQELLNSTDQTAQLREKLGEKDTLIRSLESDVGQLTESVQHKDKVIQGFESRLQNEAEETKHLKRRLKMESDDHRKEVAEIYKGFEKDLKVALKENEAREAQHQQQVESLQAELRSNRMDFAGKLKSLKEAMQAEQIKFKSMKLDLDAARTETESAKRAAEKHDQLRAEMVREHQHTRDQWDIQLQKSKDKLQKNKDRLKKQSETVETVLKENDVLRDAERRLEIQRQELAKRYGAECRHLEARIAKTEESMLSGRYAQVGSILLVPLHPPTSVGKSRRPQIFEAWTAPEMPEGWISYWEDSQNAWVFVNEHTNEDQSQRPTTPPPKPPKLPEIPMLESLEHSFNAPGQEANKSTTNEASKAISKNKAPITPPPTPSIAEPNGAIFQLPTTTKPKALPQTELTARCKEFSEPKSDSNSKGEAALGKQTTDRTTRQRAMFGISRSTYNIRFPWNLPSKECKPTVTVQTNSTKSQVKSTAHRSGSVLTYLGGWIVLCCILVYLLAMVFTEGYEEIDAICWRSRGILSGSLFYVYIVSVSPFLKSTVDSIR
ncbi:uncharacterized protein PAC_02164 [Phialocephala subalpina]|uniref:Fungal N-terminal domain-containing protein n=1 Tax=Phialocephala subalpina TaxID=576137 RepID=A0A1L7WHQ5_9HELO|nr:uncharacterized protein PAC_02164 [Phialocephala subalpina]